MTVASKIKQTIAGLKGVQETLHIYALQSQDLKMMDAFRYASDMTDEILRDLDERLDEVEYEEPQYRNN